MEQESFTGSNGTHEEEGGYADPTYSGDSGWESQNYSPGGHVSRESETSSGTIVGGGYQAIYRSGDQAEFAKFNRVDKQIEAANRDGILNEVPNDPAYQLPYIERLYNAFMSVETTGPHEIIDKTGKNGALAQAAQRIRDNKYPPHAVEEVCWEIFKKAQWAQAGVRLVDLHHGPKFESHTSHATFDDRWDNIVDSCRRSKALCKMNLDPSFIDRFVCNPDAEYKMKLNNKKINAQRDEQNEIGRTFLSNGLGKRDAKQLLRGATGEGDDDDEDDVSTSLSSLQAGFSPEAPVTPAPKARQTRGASAKRRKTWSTDTEDGDDDDDDDEYVDSAYRSSTGPTRRSSRQAASSKSQAASSQLQTISNKKPRLPTPSVRTGRAPRLLAMNVPHNSNGYNSEHNYKTIILDLLGVDTSMIKLDAYTLDQLRIYARAYNDAFKNIQWKVPGWLDWNALGYRVSNGTQSLRHIALLDEAFLPLAYARGDLLENKNRDLNKSGNRTFDARSGFDRQALGIDRNHYGFHPTYPVPQPVILASQSQLNIKNIHAGEDQRGWDLPSEGYRSEQIGSHNDQNFDQRDSHSQQTVEHYNGPVYAQPDFKPQNSREIFSSQNFNRFSAYESVDSLNDPRCFERQPRPAHSDRYTNDGYQYDTNHFASNYSAPSCSPYSNDSSHEGSQYPDPSRFSSDQYYHN
ncbi:hypothetical protein ACMFMG_005533 [Clarireedia jacksonii]